MKQVRILFLGDVVGAPGRAMVQKHLASLKAEHAIDAVIVNGENCSAEGKGITPDNMKFFKHLGVNVVTTGNHIWARKEIYPYLDEHTDIIRPANFPSDTPGKGVTTFLCKGFEIAVINLQGRVFMKEHTACPFRTAESLLTYVRSKTNLIFIDFHAEATSEKMGLAYFLDGRISGIVGTHTHIQTADERVLPNGTAYISDLGMAGSLNSMLGMKKEPIIRQFLTQMPVRFSVDNATPLVMSGVWIEVDTQSGLATQIQRVRIIDQDLSIQED